MKKWLKRISLGSFCLLLCLFAGGWFLLGTQRGTDFIVSQLVKQLDGQLQVGAAKGRVLDRLELSKVVFASPAGKAQINRFALDWKSTDLFSLHLHVVEIAADGLSYGMIPKEAEVEAELPSEPFTLPELSLPITITLEKLAVTDVRFLVAPDAAPVVVEKAALSLHWDTTGIQLSTLSVRMPEGTLEGHGQLNPVGAYPLQLQMDIESIGTDLPSLQLHADCTGDLQDLQLALAVKGDIRAELNIDVTEVVTDPAWDGTIRIHELRPDLFSPEVPGVLTGELLTRGDLKQASVTAALAMRDEEGPEMNWDADLDVSADLESLQFTVRQLALDHLNTEAHIALSGLASVDQKLDLALEWQKLQWPVVGDSEFASDHGELTITGSVDDYLLQLASVLSGTQLPDGKWQLEAKGNRESAEIVRLQGNILEGVLSIRGAVQWAPQVEWQVVSESEGINPEEFSAEWPGEFAWLLQSEGRLQEEGVSATVTLAQLNGSLRELPVTGNADITIQANDIVIKNLHLASGNAQLTAAGNLGEHSDLELNLDVLNLSDLLPDAVGSVAVHGVVKGALSQPQVTLQVSADSLVVPQAELEQLQLDANIDASWEKPFQVKLTARGLQSGNNEIKQLQLTADGSRENHSLAVSASHEMADIRLGLQGGYLKEQWQGLLNVLQIEGTDVGSWQLAVPAKVTAGATAATMEKMCLTRKNADLCLDGSWNGDEETTKANVDLSGFALAWLSPWFPETLESLDGIFSVHASLDMKEKIEAMVAAEITPGELQYRTDAEVTGTIAHEGGKVDLHVADNGLQADFLFSLDSNVLRGKVQLPDVLQVEETSDAKITAELFVDASQFAVVEALVEGVQNLDATVDMDFKVEGNLGEPDVTGKGGLQIINALIPLAGLELKNTVIDITAADKVVSLHGIFHSPGGSLALDGNLQIDAEQNWPAHFTLKADSFRLVNLPEAQVYLNSDLVLEKKADHNRLSGEIDIPKAELLIRELAPGSATVSPDVVILQEREEAVEEVKSPLEMDLRVSLGKDVHFAGFGVNAFINGQLSLTAKPEEQMLGSGEFHIKQGTYRAYGQDLEIERGVISFPGGPLTQPGINLRAKRTVGEVVAGISAIGPALKPRLTTFSRPPMSESSIISYLLTGAAPEGGSGGVKVSIGRQINNKLSVSVGTDIKTGDSEFIARYRLNRKIYVQTTTGTNSNAADIFYTLEVGGVGELVSEIVKEDLKMNVFDKEKKRVQ